MTPSNSFCSAPTLRSHLSSAARQGLSGDEAGAGVGDAQFRGLVGLVVARWMADNARHRDDALLDQIVAVLQRERILIAQRHRLAQRCPELALVPIRDRRALRATSCPRSMPTPGAVIAAQAVPDDCGRLPPLASFSARDLRRRQRAPGASTVMSAPILVSRNGERDCLTDTAEVPFAFSFDDHEVSELIARISLRGLRGRSAQGRRRRR